MKNLKRTIIAAAALTAVGGASAGVMPTLVANDTAGPPAQLIVGVYNPAQPVQLEQASWVWGGANYCWYPGGWRGPGYYRCGFAWRTGFGWGGPIGWNGWRGGGWHPGWHRGWRNRGGWRGDRGGWRGGHGDWHGDRRGGRDGGHGDHGGHRH